MTHATHTISTADRVNDLLTQMTVEEKIAQIAGIWVTDLVERDRSFNPTKAAEKIGHGIGHITRISAATLLTPTDSVKLANTIQKYLVEQTRLGIPAIVHEESCAGFMARGATTFPQSIGLAATWDDEAMQRMADVIRQQMRAVGAHHTLAPVLDVARDGRWGRMEETYGEDPFLISAMGTAYIRGVQSDDLSQGIIATAKHFLSYGWSEGGMNWAPAHVPARELREIFLTPFKAAIEEANVRSFMNAYHELDGIPLGSSVEYMQDLLRDEMGFTGTVVSDYFTLKMFMEYHAIASTQAEAAHYGLLAGIDVELPGADCYGQPLLDALNAGSIDIALVDACVRRVLEQKFEVGVFDHSYVDEGSVVNVYQQPDHIALSLELARKSLVLLKNDGVLPLSKSVKKIALIGPSADSARNAQGDYHYPSHLEGMLDPNTSLAAPTPEQRGLGVDWSNHLPPSVTVLQGIRSLVSANTEIQYAKGCDILSTDTSGFATAVEAAKSADVAIVVLGDKSGLSLGSTTGESIDTATLRLPGVQSDLLKAIHATGTPVVLVLMTGRPYTLVWEQQNIPAILEAWLPAEQGGQAIGEALFGNVNPSGKLPVSFPRSVGQLPVYYNHKTSGGRTHWQGDYIDESTKPLYAFGHGLSYTTFAYSDLHVDKTEVAANDILQVSLTLTNTGNHAGDEVVQLYIRDCVSSVTRPIKELKGFKRVTLQPNESKRVTFTFDVCHFAFYDRDMRYIVEPGEVQLMLGASSDDIRLTQNLQIVGVSTEVKQVYSTIVEVSM